MEKSSRTKYIFITGGMVSSLGKGAAAASLGALLQARGYTVYARKFDPYLNIDPGSMSPLQHGEVYVTDDGFETDLDVGYYERFLGVKLSRDGSVSGGRIFWDVLNAERRGDYKGATIQLIPQITDKIKEYITAPAGTDFVLCEIGGTVGDIEGLIFLEAARQLAHDVGRRNVMFVHLTLAPFLENAGELKTKPTQHSVRILLEKGIQADMLIVRSVRMLDMDERKKVSLFCNIPPGNVISGINVDNIYRLPLVYEAQHACRRILEHFGLADRKANISKFRKIAEYLDSDKPPVTIAMVGKYFHVADAYKSLNEALFHAGMANDVRVNINTIDSEALEKMTDAELKKALGKSSGILVPGGFGRRGIKGKIRAAKFARENNVPYLGICFGMQLAVIEFMRNVCGVLDAGSTEFEKKCEAVIDIMPEYDNPADGSTLRLGARQLVIKPGTLAHRIYKKASVSERHRHRYTLNMKYRGVMEKHGMIISGSSPDGALPEILEIKKHPFFIGVQYHPEFQSSPYTSHPLFMAFIKAAMAS
ncbi:MAG: CTP synthase [Alphaproteobacteria bacterium]|nr:CTP synthase [Alphaproteobacteria bacterium]MCL2757897.1 CTP synthase [Alphaproteobacteria bacterium]